MIRTLSTVAMATALITVAFASAAQAGDFQQEGCHVTVPADWKITKTRAIGPGHNSWAEITSGGTADEGAKIEQSFGAAKLSEDGRIILMVSSVSGSGQTNKLFHAITKTTPSCIIDVATPAGAGEAQAKAIAMTAHR
jgi:hypothetical protein